MPYLNSKICVLGDFAVGKTSTVERFVNNHFSEKYQTTIGVKVDTKDLALSGNVNLKLVIWDIAGSDQFGSVELAYLRGASGLILVADGTRSQTIFTALDLKSQAEKSYGPVPWIFLLNKSDLSHTWEVSENQLMELTESWKDVYVTSAKSGDNVEAAITRLGEMVIDREIG